MFHSFPASVFMSNKALPHLASLVLITIHGPQSIYGQQYEQYEQYEQYAQYQDGQVDYNQPNQSDYDQPNYDATYNTAYDTTSGAQDQNALTSYNGPTNVEQPTEWIGMNPQQDFSVQQDFSPQQTPSWYGEAENWNNANACQETFSCQESSFPYQDTPQECVKCAQNTMQEAEPEPAETCNAPAYCQSTKITKLRPITVIAGLLVVSIVAVAILSNQAHQHTAKSQSHCRSCR